jgi:uncharacterized protein YndB with AHSA1/START domain
MTDLRITRTFAAPPELVFDFLTRRRHLLDWWGPEGTSLPDENLDFTRPGPWHSVMMNADGRRFKVSGQVVEVTPPRAVAFTWGWHDEDDDRGPESLVRIELHPVDSGTEFRLTHADLPGDDSSANHERGWTSSLAKLERLLA